MHHTCQTGMWEFHHLFFFLSKQAFFFWRPSDYAHLKINELTIKIFGPFLLYISHIFNVSYSSSQDELGCRVDFLLDRCFQTEREEMETMENVNRLLLQNVLPLHVASFFIGKTIRNQVKNTNQHFIIYVFYFPHVHLTKNSYYT